MRVCLDFDHLCSIAFFTLITCLRKRGKRDNILIAFLYIYIYKLGLDAVVTLSDLTKLRKFY